MATQFAKSLFCCILVGGGLFACTARGMAQTGDEGGKYHTPSEVHEILNEIHDSNRSITKVYNLAESPGSRELLMIEIGPEVDSNGKTVPAIFVVGNLEGTIPISTEASLYLIDEILENDAATDKTWYILPNGNPDAATNYFAAPMVQDSRNDQPHNDDMDENTDEDGWEDLNGDGLITQMRVKDPTGDMMIIEAEPLLMKKADPSKGEKGAYKVYTEGIDNDGDGSYNEDSEGGVNVNRNFPHLFEDFTETGGSWPGSTPEVYAILEFAFSHPEIAMTFSLGDTNFSMVAPKGGRQGSVDYNEIEIPESFTEQLGADPSATYTMDEVIEMVKPLAPPGFEITESVVASFLGLGAVINPLEDDLKFYNELADQYKEYLEEQEFSTERIDPAAASDGSFELWSYYHLGIPTFSMDFWTLPEFKEESEGGSGLTIDQMGEMSPDEFVELGEEKISMFLEEVGAPKQFNAERVIDMVEGGQVTPQRMAAMMEQMPKPPSDEGIDPEDKALIAFNENVLNGEGIVAWETYDHPTLGEVEIGGEVPYVRNTPPASMIDSLLTVQVPWILTLSEKIPKLGILKTSAKELGKDVYEVSVWVENERYLPFPTAMGVKNENPRPAIITLEGDDIGFLSGKQRTAIDSIGGLETKKFTWILKTPDPDEVTIHVESDNAWNDSEELNAGGAQ